MQDESDDWRVVNVTRHNVFTLGVCIMHRLSTHAEEARIRLALRHRLDR